jgi:hypothetical protein
LGAEPRRDEKNSLIGPKKFSDVSDAQRESSLQERVTTRQLGLTGAGGRGVPGTSRRKLCSGVCVAFERDTSPLFFFSSDIDDVVHVRRSELA